MRSSQPRVCSKEVCRIQGPFIHQNPPKSCHARLRPILGPSLRILHSECPDPQALETRPQPRFLSTYQDRVGYSHAFAAPPLLIQFSISALKSGAYSQVKSKSCLATPSAMTPTSWSLGSLLKSICLFNSRTLLSRPCR